MYFTYLYYKNYILIIEKKLGKYRKVERRKAIRLMFQLSKGGSQYQVCFLSICLFNTLVCIFLQCCVAFSSTFLLNITS